MYMGDRRQHLEGQDPVPNVLWMMAVNVQQQWLLTEHRASTAKVLLVKAWAEDQHEQKHL